MRLLIIIPFVFYACISNLHAHGDLDLRIQAITTDIATYPDSAALYFNRGKLRFQHEEYQEAINDINYSVSIGYTHELQNIYLAKSLFNLSKYKKANSTLDLFLEEDPNNVVGLNLKARILFAQNHFEASALYFEKVIDTSIKSLPENYIEAAFAWTKSSNPNKYKNTINILELGLKNLGPIVTLQNKIIDTHIEENNIQAAINIQLSILKKSKRKESAFYRIAELYILAGDQSKAKDALQKAKTHWNKLPRRIQRNAAMKLLQNKIEELTTNL